MVDKKYGFFLIIAVFGAYLNSLPNQFIFDDIPLVQNSLNVVEMGFWDLVRSYRPLRYISYALDYRIFGMNPWGFRLMNIFYHSLTVIAVFWMLQVFGLTKRAAFISALLFAIHPVNTDSVAYISGRRDVIMGLFYVLSIGMFMKFYNGVRQSRVENDQRSPLHAVADCTTPSTGEQSSPTSTGRNMVLPLLFSLLFMFFSISSKEMGATIPLVYILYIFYKDGSKLFAKKWFYVTMMVFLLLFSFFAFTAISGGGSGLVSLDGVHYHGNSPQVHYLTATTIWLHYLKQAIFPFWLILDNANFPLVLDWNFKVFFSILSMFVYGGMVWRLVSGGNNNSPNPSLKKRGISPLSFEKRGVVEDRGELGNSIVASHPSLVTRHASTAFFLVFFVIALAPVLQIIPLHEIVAEHYLYVPIIGFCAVFGMVSDLWSRGMVNGGMEDNNSLNPSLNNSPNPSLKKRGNSPLSLSKRGRGESSHPSLLTAHCSLTKKTALGLVFLVITIFSAQTIRRNFQLKDHWTVFHADQKVAPLSFRGYFTLGAEYVGMKFPDKAFEYYQKALDTGSWDGNLLSNIIGYHILKGDHSRAISYFEEMEKRGELITSSGVLNVSVLYMLRGNCERAVPLASSFNPFANQVARVELVKNCEKHNFARFDNNSVQDIHEKQLLMKELGLEIERKPYLRRLLQATDSVLRTPNTEKTDSHRLRPTDSEHRKNNSKEKSVSSEASSVAEESINELSVSSETRSVAESEGEHMGSPLQLIRELAVVNLQSDIPEAIFYYKMERDLRQKMGKPVPEIVEKSIQALEHYKHQVLVEGKYLRLDW